MRRSLVLLTLVLVTLLGAMAAKPLLVQPPPLRGHSTAGEFDAKRGMARLAYLLGDERPHPTDTAANDQVRGRIVTLLQQMGLTPVVRDQLACNELYKARGVSCARVRNVIAMLGPASGKALLLNVHYDSSVAGPGAGDAGSGVATLLEIASILKERPLRRPVIFLFNEGEELGLVGARAFLADPLSRNVDSLINLEARGVRGPVNMFETSRPNGRAIGVYSRAVANPVANSLSTDVYRLMPNYTDVNTFAERGWLTLNLAPIGNETRYHSPGDDLAALDLATLQHMGDQTLALTQALANGAPGANGGERIFMDLAGRTLVTLPLALGFGLLLVLLAAFAWLSLTRCGVVRGLSVVLGSIVLSGALSWLALALLGALRAGMFWRAYPLWTHLAVTASAILVSAVLLATLGRRSERRQLRSHFWLVTVVVGAVVVIIAPGGIIFFLFPPLIALIGIIAARWWRPAEAVGSALAALLLYLTWGAMLGLLEELLNQGPMWLFAPLGALLILPVLIEAKPLIDKIRLRSAAAVAGALALLGWAAAGVAPAYSADRQQRFTIQHVTDASTGRLHWTVLNDGAPLPEGYRAAGEWDLGKLPYSDRRRWLAPTTSSSGAKAPDIQLLEVVRNGKERAITLKLRANGNERIELIAPKDSTIRAAGVQGFVRPIQPQESGKYYLDCFGRRCDGLTLMIVAGRPEPIDFLVFGSRPGLPPQAAPLLSARPAFARPQYARDETIAFSRRRL